MDITTTISLEDFPIGKCDPNFKDVEIKLEQRKIDKITNQPYYYNLATADYDFGEPIIGSIMLEKDLNKYTTLKFNLLVSCNEDNIDHLPLFSQIRIQMVNNTTNKTSNVFFGYVLKKNDKSTSRKPFKQYQVECVAYEKVLYDTIVVQRWDDKNAIEIINDIWTNRLLDANKYNFPKPEVDASLTEPLGRIAHEDSIERLLDVLAKRTDSVWYFDDYATLHFVSKVTLNNNVEVLNQVDYKDDATPLQLTEDLSRYANQVKFKAKNIKGNYAIFNIGVANSSGILTFDEKIFHNIDVLKDGIGDTYKLVKVLDKTSPVKQYVLNSGQIQIHPTTSEKFIVEGNTNINNTVYIKDDKTEQGRLKQLMEMGFVISVDITTERPQTPREIKAYMDMYLKNSIKPVYSGKMTVFNALGGSYLGRWGFDKKAINIKGLEYIYQGNSGIKTATYPDVNMVISRKIIQGNFHHSRIRNGKQTLSVEDFIVINEFEDGLKDVWMHYFKRDKRQFFDNDVNDNQLNEEDITESVTFDIIADSVELNGASVPTNDTSLTKSRETGTITKAMVI